MPDPSGKTRPDIASDDLSRHGRKGCLDQKISTHSCGPEKGPLLFRHRGTDSASKSLAPPQHRASNVAYGRDPSTLTCKRHMFD
jgi:hypothetical protein